MRQKVPRKVLFKCLSVSWTLTTETVQCDDEGKRNTTEYSVLGKRTQHYQQREIFREIKDRAEHTQTNHIAGGHRK